jgi:hypothetical protein
MIYKQVTRFLFTGYPARAVLFIAGILQIGICAAAVPFEGTATLCAINPFGSTTETRGNNGVTYTYDLVMLYRIQTDNPLMNGWEVLTSNSKLSKNNTGYYWGDAVLTPDLHAGTGTLVDQFKFNAQQSANISGTYSGTGDLDGTTVEYELSVDPNAAFCDTLPPQCNSVMPCIPICESCGEGFNVPFGYLMNGLIE